MGPTAHRSPCETFRLDCDELWRSFPEHPFLKELQAGTLPLGTYEVPGGKPDSSRPHDGASTAEDVECAGGREEQPNLSPRSPGGPAGTRSATAAVPLLPDPRLRAGGLLTGMLRRSPCEFPRLGYFSF